MVMGLSIDFIFCCDQVRVRELSDEEQAAANLLTTSGYLAIEPSDSDQGASVVTFISTTYGVHAILVFLSRPRQDGSGCNAHSHV